MASVIAIVSKKYPRLLDILRKLIFPNKSKSLSKKNFKQNTTNLLKGILPRMLMKRLMEEVPNQTRNRMENLSVNHAWTVFLISKLTKPIAIRKTT